MWGKALAAVERVPGHGGIPVPAVKPKGFLELRRRRDPAVLENAAVRFTGLVEGIENPAGELQGLGHQHVQSFGVEFAVTLELAQAPVIQLVAKDEENVVFVDFEMSHSHTSASIGLRAEIALNMRGGRIPRGLPRGAAIRAAPVATV